MTTTEKVLVGFLCVLLAVLVGEHVVIVYDTMMHPVRVCTDA
jgi:hypothetical protein